MPVQITELIAKIQPDIIVITVTLANKQPKSNNKPSTVSTTKEKQTSSRNTFTMSASAYTASCGGCSGFTTTGYASTDFNKWPEFSKFILVMLMFSGACAGSTGGGMKVSRLVIMLKTVKK